MSTITPTLTQIEYALAIAQHGSFRAAARACHVSQPALSAQVAKLEEGLGVVLFDRKTRPVIPTDKGTLLLPRFEAIVAAVREVEEIASAEDDAVRGELRLGIIPTLAPYLLPRFLPGLVAEHPALQVVVRELTTDEIVEALRTDGLDAGVLATPLHAAGIHELRLFDEPLRIYAAPASSLPVEGKAGRRLTVEQLPTRELVVMTEGHCLRTQVLDLCELGDASEGPGFQLETGSLSTLVRMIDEGPWFTVLPELALDELGEEARTRVFEFAGPRPYREVGLVFRRPTYRAAAREAVADAIVAAVPSKWRRRARGRRVDPV